MPTWIKEATTTEKAVLAILALIVIGSLVAMFGPETVMGWLEWSAEKATEE